MNRDRKKRISGFVYLLPIAGLIFCVAALRNAPSTDAQMSEAIPITLQTTPSVTEAASSRIDHIPDPQESLSLEGGGIIIQDVPHIYQTDDYPTGCESVAAVSLLQFHGIRISVEDFIDNHLPIADYPYYEDDVMYGNSPWDAFIGDPYSKSGYGCYSTAIAKAMKSAVPQDFEIRTISNVPLPSLCSEYLDKGQPVLVWATMDMQEPYEGKTWVLPNGDTFTFICPEHALVLVGYDESSYYFCDPQKTDAIVSYPKQACETAFDALHQQAIVMLPTT